MFCCGVGEAVQIGLLVGSVEDLRLIDDHRHSHLAMICLSTVDPDRHSIVYNNLEDGLLLSRGGLEAGEDAAIWLDGHTWLGEGGGNHGVVLGEVVEVDLVSDRGRHNRGCKGEAIFSDLDVDGLS